MDDKPVLTSTNHILPFGELSPAQFERLCLWLVEHESYARAEHLGEAGSEQGRDVIAYDAQNRLWYFQCKRYQTVSAETLKAEVEKYNEHIKAGTIAQPYVVVFVTNAVVSAKARKQVETLCRKSDLACEWWARTELDFKVKKHAAIVKEFFNLPTPTTNPAASVNASGERNVVIRGNATNVTIITGDASTINSPSPQSAIHTPQPAIVKISLPAPLTPHLFGRADELRLLDDAWANPSTNLVVFHALGGAGKSALVSKWLAELAKKNYDGTRRVFGWSFFSQGSSENRSDSSEAFIDNALAFFGVTVEGAYFRKADRLAEALRAERTILILDGVEPLQYPPNSAGLPEGGLKDRALQTILTQLAAQQPGLCVITSRERLSDLNGYDEATVIQRALDRMPYATAMGEQPCAQLLRALGATGDDTEMLQAAQAFQGHAYGLTLLGSYVAEVLGGDLRRRKDIANLFDDDRFGSQADRMIAAYEKWLGDGVEVAILRLLGLFDRPAEAASIAALREAPAIAGLTETLQGLSEVKWQQALSRLRRLNLLSHANAHASHDLDAHPLVREHFRQHLKTHAPDAWRAGNSRLYEHLTRTTKDLPDTLTEMQPLFAAVTHGCAAGRQQQALNDVYWRRILRGNKYFNLIKLGAYGADLAALTGFFLTPWQQPVAGLTEAEQAIVLNQAGVGLRALGRLKEAVQPMRASLEKCISHEEWEGAALRANNLSELYLTIGDVPQSFAYTRQGAVLADQSGDSFMKIVNRTTLADVLHQAGHLNEAEEIFRKSEAIQQESEPLYPVLYSLQGVQYCDLLLARGKYQEVQARASQTLEWAKHGLGLKDIALDNLSLGRAWLLQARQEGGSLIRQLAFKVRKWLQVREEGGGAIAQAEDFLKRAVDGLRQAGTQHLLPRGLLARTEMYRLTGAYASAQADLAEARAIAERGEMRLHLADYHLESARLALALHDTAKARAHYDAARKLIDETGYHRRDGELREIEQLLD